MSQEIKHFKWIVPKSPLDRDFNTEDDGRAMIVDPQTYKSLVTSLAPDHAVDATKYAINVTIFENAQRFSEVFQYKTLTGLQPETLWESTVTHMLRLFLEGTLQEVILSKPFGSLLEYVFDDVLDVAQGQQLDDLGRKWLGMFRNVASIISKEVEDDVTFRERLQDYSVFLNDLDSSCKEEKDDAPFLAGNGIITVTLPTANASNGMSYYVRMIGGGGSGGSGGSKCDGPGGEGRITVTEWFDSPKTVKTCDHSWKNYHGFTEQYDYCEKCDQRK